MKQPSQANFVVDVREGGIEVTFQPTNSTYSYYWLADEDDIRRVGPISREPRVRHADSGDTGEYHSGEVQELAYQVARDAAIKRAR